MLNLMPYKLIKILRNMRNIGNFFGFIKVEVTISSDCRKILLPRRMEDRIIYQAGTFVGVYFSEELKLYSRNSYYKIKFLELYEFSKIDLFKLFVNDFYTIKQNSVGALRFIAKSILNNLYGYFGRNYDLISTSYIKNTDLTDLLAQNITIKSIDNKDDYSLINYINHNDEYLIKGNVAIASAITSYARITMYPFLILPNTLYSDT